MTRKTAGQLSIELLKSAYKNDHTPHDQAQEQLTDYEKNVHEAAKLGKIKFDTDFYITVLLKKEPLMPNIIRFYYFSRQSCPTPQHDQIVYRYHRESGDIEFMWVVPSLEACVTLVNEALMAHPDEKQLLQCVLDFRDGTLLRKAKELNGEYINKEVNGRKSRTSNPGLIA